MASISTLFLGYIYSWLLRTELFSSGFRIFCAENTTQYYVVVTLHAFVMVFMVVMPSLYGGLGNALLPIFLGVGDLAYSRLNNNSVLLLLIGFIIMMEAGGVEFGPATGWTLYPPLSTTVMQLAPLSIDLTVISLFVLGLSSVLSSVNFVVTGVNLRVPGLPVRYISLWAVSILVTAMLLVIVLPVLSGALIMLLGDLHYNTVFFDANYGGDSVLFQHLFWFFGHPEVYVLILPAFGVVSHILVTTLMRTVFGYQSMMMAMIGIAFIGGIVWGHHMYSVGLELDTRCFFSAATMMIAIPTGNKVGNWICC